jgi:hypothetical protein
MRCLTRILALIAVYLATMRDYAPYLAPCEVATIAVLAADRSQARVIFRFVIGLLKAIPLLEPMIVSHDAETITLSNWVVIEIATASFRLSPPLWSRRRARAARCRRETWRNRRRLAEPRTAPPGTSATPPSSRP